MQVGDIVECYEQRGIIGRLIYTGRIVRETATQWLMCHDMDLTEQYPTRFSKKTLAEVPQYVTPRFIRPIKTEEPAHAHAE